MSADEKIQELENQIRNHDHAYWQEAHPTISDEDYDALVLRLQTLDPTNPLLRRLPEPEGTVRHEQPMLSLNKAYTRHEVKNWLVSVARDSREVFSCNVKFDGVSAWFDGKRLVSRGDGYKGEDWGSKIRYVAGLVPGRGEIIIKKSDFTPSSRQTLAKIFGREYKTERNAVAGIMNLKEMPVKAPRTLLKFIPHNHKEDCFRLDEFDLIDWDGVLADARTGDIPADGLVIKVADKEYGASLGDTDHHPRWALAWKFKNPATSSRVVGVEWQVAKTRITPVAILEPTELDGVTISRATLHNLAEIKRLGVGVGSKVTLERAGAVIPAITATISEGEGIEPPATCPACGTATSNDGQDVFCNNNRCGGMLAKRLQDSLSRLGLENCGPAVCSSLVSLGFTSPVAVLRMQQSDWLGVDGFAARSAEKMHKQVAALILQPIEDYKLLAAMNFEGMGLTLAKRVCDKMSLAEITPTLLEQVDGIGTARSRGIELTQELQDLVMILNVVSTKGSLSGPTVCFTGADVKPREEWIAFAKKAGYNYAKSVTKGLSLLVLSDIESQSSKAKKARDYNIKTITYEEFARGKGV